MPKGPTGCQMKRSELGRPGCPALLAKNSLFAASQKLAPERECVGFVRVNGRDDQSSKKLIFDRDGLIVVFPDAVVTSPVELNVTSPEAITVPKKMLVALF